MTMPGNDVSTGAGAPNPKIQKLAAFLMMLTPENAAQILKGLDDELVEQVAGEMSGLTNVPQEMQLAVLEEFSPVAQEAATAVRGGVERTQHVLERSVGIFRASEIMSRVSPTRAAVAATEQIAEMDPSKIYHLLKHEQPQTIAMFLSYLSPERAAKVLSLLRPEQRNEVVERLATLSPTSNEIIQDVLEVLRSNAGAQRTQPLNNTGGVKAAAQLINALPKPDGKAILSSLSERNAELAEAVHQKMFAFEDFRRLDVRSLQKILQQVEVRTLTVALKAASEQLKETFLSALSRRGAENVREELDSLNAVKLKEIQAAQLEIIEAARRLETEGELDMSEL